MADGVSTNIAPLIFVAILITSANCYQPERSTEQSEVSEEVVGARRLQRHEIQPQAPSSPVIGSKYIIGGSEIVPEHMRKFHQRVLEQIHSSASETSGDEYLEKSPQHMLRLYHNKKPSKRNAQVLNRKQNHALARSDVVRSFQVIDSFKDSKKFVLIFDTSAVFEQERIRLAEIQLQLRPDDQDVTSLELWDERKSMVEGKIILQRTLIGEVPLPGRRTPSATLEVTREYRRWHTFQNKDDREMTPHKHSTRTKRDLSTREEILFVYSTNKNIDLLEVALARQDRSRRSSRRHQAKHRRGKKHKSTKRRNRYRLRNKTERQQTAFDEMLTNEVEDRWGQENNIPVSNELEFGRLKTTSRSGGRDDTAIWRKEQEKSVGSTRKDDVIVVPNKSPVTPKPSSYSPARANPSIPPHCRRVDFEIDFEAIGWGDWIVYPKRYNAFRCEGQCKHPVSQEQGRPSNHAYMQSLLSSHDPTLGIPQPCCVPTALKSLSILYYEDGYVKQRDHEDMTVAECGCR
ncbi:unnamed protein product [Clavelina lepadiformis]|uniref:TGF-beta family profile domain-containing protein n=1 Tax=Clavelina lepadiformis TaxID=159417 RepID=A0ABP0G312_CLALP